jgi:lysozyme
MTHKFGVVLVVLGLVSVTVAATPTADIIKKYEGFRANAYRDAGGWSVGYGHVIQPGEPRHVTEPQASRMLSDDVAIREQIIAKLVRVPLTPNQRAALVSLVYNIGEANFRHSTLLRLLNQRDYAGTVLVVRCCPV